MVNSKMLKDRAKSLGIRQVDIASALGLQQSTVNQKLNNVRPMMLNEAEVIADMLKISGEEFTFYFFAEGGNEVHMTKNDRREISFEFEEGVKLTVDRVAGTKGYDCKVWASDRTAVIKGLCVMIQQVAEEGDMSIEEVICRVAASLLAPSPQEGGGNVEAEKDT